MALDLRNYAGTVPSGTEFPGTVQGMLDLIAAYLGITGGENFTSINFGPDEPDAESRDFPWFKTDMSGSPLGWYSWSGAAWTLMPVNIPSGNTASRPASPTNTNLYFDTDINVLLVYYGSQWRTAAGSPGDVKEVKKATLAEALAANPGWVQDPDSLGRVVIAAGEGSGLTPRAYAETGGNETVTLGITQIPEHTHTVSGVNNVRWQADGNATNAGGNLSGWGGENTGSTPDLGTGGLAHNNMQPFIAYWRLVKE